MLRALLIAGLAAVAAPVASAGPDDFFNEKSKDFGPTPRGPVLVHYFYIKNTTSQPMSLGQARVSCGCVAAQVLKYSLAPGETTAVQAQMDSRRIPRTYENWPVTVFVPVYGGPQPGEARLVVQAVAREDLFYTEPTFAFGTVKKGKGGTVTTKVTFQSDPKWEVSEVKSNGTHVKAEAKLASRNGNSVTYDVTATLDPTCPAGNWTAEVFLHTNNKAVDKLRIPVTVDVPNPIVASTDAAANAVKVGDSTTREIVLKSADPFKVLGVKGSDESVVVQTSGAEPKEAKEHRIALKVSPNKPGNLARTFEITTDHKEQPKVEVEFKATAIK